MDLAPSDEGSSPLPNSFIDKREGSSWGAAEASRTASLAPEVLTGDAVGLVAGMISVTCAWLLYSRIHSDRLLLNARRRAVWECIQRHPYTTTTAIARVAQLHPTTVEHHLEVLHRHGLVVRRDLPRGPVFAVAGAVGDDVRLAVVATGEHGIAFLRKAAEMQGQPQAVLAAELGLARSTVSRRVAILEKAGWLTRQHGRIEVTPEGRTILQVAAAGL